MILIPKDLSGYYPEDVTELLKQLEDNYDEEDDLDDFYGSSVRLGCDCGCGGDTMSDSWADLMEDRGEILFSLKELGYVVEGEGQSYGTDDIESEG